MTSTGIAIVLCVLLGLLFFLGHKMVVRAIARISEVMSDLARGDLHVAIPYEGRKDEVGAMARAVAVFKAQAQDNYAAKAANEYVIEKLAQVLANSPTAISPPRSRSRSRPHLMNCV